MLEFSKMIKRKIWDRRALLERLRRNQDSNWNKKGGEKLLSLWWFFILGVIGGFIVVGVTIYYSADTNTNAIESSIIVDKLADCFILNGNLNPESLNPDFDIFDKCNLDKNMFGIGSYFYFNVSIYNNTGVMKDFVNGSYFETDCRVGKKVSAKYFPTCTAESYSVSYNNNNAIVHITGGVNQPGSKVSIN